ncbi:MAG: hypothetical protein KAW17_01105 [Candidatus Eisenbacteria sp.]|nr:hypothetical protein [Candidatus Eisenbacteria bacterium]
MAGENEEKAQKEGQSSSSPGIKKILLVVVGAVFVFLASVPLHLYLQGVLSFSAPHLRPAPGHAQVDSILAVERVRLGIEVEEKQDEQEVPSRPGGTKPVVPEVVADVSGAKAVSPLEGAATTETRQENPETSPGEGSSMPGSAEPAEDRGQEQLAGDLQGAGGADSILSAGWLAEPVLPFDPSKLARLVAVYEKMRPKQVALILNTMPERQGVMILANMKDKSTAKVLAEMEPSKAARMSELLVRWDNQ